MLTTILRWSTPFLLAAALGVLIWLVPHLTPEVLGASTPRGGFMLAMGLALFLFLYLIVQGYTLGHDDIGSSSSHNLDNMVSTLPAFPAFVGIVLTLTGLYPLSYLVVTVCVLVICTVVFDLWIIGGAAARINRLLNELRMER